MVAIIGMFFQDGLTGSAWGDWALYTASPLRAFENELGVQDPVGFWDPVGYTNDGDVQSFKRRRTVELKHGRISMLATMGYRQEYEMCRTKSDISLFAKEMATDPAVVARLEGALATSSGWLRDSACLWIRFYALYADGETELSTADGERLRRAVDAAIESFERDHGGHPDFVGAMYQQASVAVLSASFSGLSTRAVAAQARRVGEAALRVFRRHYGSHPRSAAHVRERLNRDYTEAVSDIVWGSCAGGDPILKTFFAAPPPCAPCAG